jgi:hypothetical protein
MSDVTAVVLSIGEDYTERAIASVRRQSLRVKDTIVVRGVSPFSRAINEGAARVRTPFFIQVDADMILDDTCVADLRSCMSDQLGLVIGHLRDPLRGRVLGIKLFRSRCFEHVQFRDSICQDIDFGEEILRRGGWTKAYALKRSGDTATAWHSFGEHRPDYNPHYTFCKFMVEGVRARARGAEGKFQSLVRQLRGSAHPMAPTAIVATAHGLFCDIQQDLLVPYAASRDAECLERFLEQREAFAEPLSLRDVLGGESPAASFRRFYEYGVRFRQRHQPASFLATLRNLLEQDGAAALLALTAMCHGLFYEEYDELEAEAAFASLPQLLPAGSAAKGYAGAAQDIPSCETTAR